MRLRIEAELIPEPPWIVAHAKSLDVSSCGETPEKALLALIEAIRLFVETTQDMGTFEQVLIESGYVLTGEDWTPAGTDPSHTPIESSENNPTFSRCACVEI